MSSGCYGDIFTDQVRERFLVFWLDASNKVIGFEVVTEGTLNTSLVHPREVFRGAIVATAASIIVAHNHPSPAIRNRVPRTSRSPSNWSNLERQSAFQFTTISSSRETPSPPSPNAA